MAVNLSAKPRGEWGEGLWYFSRLPRSLVVAPLPKLYFARAIPPATQANAVLDVITNGSNRYIASTHAKSLEALGEIRPSPPVLLFSLHQAQQCCQLRHVISLWRLLTLERARLLMKRGEVRNTVLFHP